MVKPKALFDTSNCTHRVLEGDALQKLDLVDDGSCRLAITSPPYNIRKEYERDSNYTLAQYLDWSQPIIGKVCNKIADNGHVCWQTGNFVEDGEVYPLDAFFTKYSKIAVSSYETGLFGILILDCTHKNVSLAGTRRSFGSQRATITFSI